MSVELSGGADQLVAVLTPLLLYGFGSIMGSFLNVVIMRTVAWLRAEAGELQHELSGLPRSLWGRSMCPACGCTLRWWELLPILSFICLRGQCARCGHTISVQYPLVEGAMGLILLLLGLPLPVTGSELGHLLLLIVVAALLLVLLVVDLRTLLLPDIFVGGLGVFVLLTVVLELIGGAPVGATLLARCGGVLVGAGFLLGLWVITRGRGIGLGDVKLMVPLGFLFGTIDTVVLLWLSFMVGGVVAVWLLLTRRAAFGTAIPFGPFLIGVALLIMVVPSLPSQLMRVVVGSGWGFIE